MKKLLFTIILFIAIPITAIAQDVKDVVYLKNGSIIKGVIIEQNPSHSIKIQLSDGSVMVYPESEILKISKEQDIKQQDNNSNSRVYDLSTLRIDGKRIVNEYGTEFTYNQMCEILGTEKANQLYSYTSKIGSMNWIGWLSIIPAAGSIPGVILSVSDVIPRDPWFALSLCAAVVGWGGIIAPTIIDNGWRAKASGILNEYRYSVYSVNVEPTIITSQSAQHQELIAGVKLCIAF